MVDNLIDSLNGIFNNFFFTDYQQETDRFTLCLEGDGFDGILYIERKSIIEMLERSKDRAIQLLPVLCKELDELKAQYEELGEEVDGCKD